MFCTQCGKQNLPLSVFCSSCGGKFSNSNDTGLTKDIGIDENFKNPKLLAQAAGCYFLGADSQRFSENIAPKFSAKNASKLVYNIYCIPNYIVLVPVSKDRRAIALWGLMLGGGTFAAGAMAGLSEYARRLELRSANDAHDKANPFYEAVLFKTDECRIVGKETRSSSADLFDMFKKETWLKVEGSASYEGNNYNLGFEFGMEGQSLDRSKKHLKLLDENWDVTGFKGIDIRKGKYPV